MALACLTIGANIAFGNITASMTGKYEANIDHLTIITQDLLMLFLHFLVVDQLKLSYLANWLHAPNPLNSGVLMMVIMAVILFFGLLPKISKYIPGHSVHGFLFI